MNEPERIKDQKLLPTAFLSEEDEFYAECNIQGINLVDRVNGKLVRAYPYWIDRPSCNWHSPPESEDDEDYFMEDEREEENNGYENDDGDENDDDRYRASGTGLINGLKRLWQRDR